MATYRDNPYGAYNFLVSLDGDDAGAARAGFTRVTGLDLRVELIRYRNGNDRSQTSRLIPGLAPNPVVALSRGIIGDLDLYTWVRAVADGQAQPRNVRIDLLSEDRSAVAQSWLLRRALPTALDGPDLDARSSEVAIETLVLVAEGIEIQ